MPLQVEPESLVEFVSAFTLAFEDALELVQQPRGHHHPFGTASEASTWTTLESCLRQAPLDIKKELIDGLDHFGVPFSLGDGRPSVLRCQVRPTNS